VESDPAWWLSVKTIDDTGLIPRSVVEQELREGQAPEWVDQEYHVKFTSALVGSYFGELLTKAEAEGRITDLAHRPTWKVTTAWDLGYSDLTVIGYFQPARDPGERIHVIDCDAYEGTGLPEIVAGMHRHAFVFERHLAPHDAEQHDLGSGKTLAQTAAGLGVRFQVVPRGDLLQGIDQVRAVFPRLVFDRRRCARLIEALGAYTKTWDAKGKVFRPNPAHTWASHFADMLRTFAMGFRDRPNVDPRSLPRYAKSRTAEAWREEWGGRLGRGSV
jgi:phage terminase large subunit